MFSNLRKEQIQELVDYAALSDMEIRSDLAANMIRNEDDYTSNFTGAFRRNINSYSKTGLRATSFLLPTKGERESGCDATIIILGKNGAKVALFEAKWPRLSSQNYSWDYKQTASGLSHFSDQLDRQSKYFSQFAIFEMFYCEYPFKQQPKEMPDYGSACVWHEDAIKFKNNRTDPDKLWSKNDLISLLNQKQTTIDQIIYNICICNKGEVITMYEPKSIIEEFRLTGNILALELE